MYIIFSTPLTCCSIGAATVSATVWALAPGYAQVTWIVGGVMSGYWAIGRLISARSPIRMMKMEMTQAKMGRSIKNRANNADLLSPRLEPGRGGLRVGCADLDLGGGHLDKARHHRDAGPD